MNPTIVPSHPLVYVKTYPGILQKAGRKMVFAMLDRLQQGHITLYENGRAFSFGQKATDASVNASLQVHDPRFYTKLLFDGSIGAGEAYMAGFWTSPEPAKVVQIVAMNQAVKKGVDPHRVKLLQPLHRLFHLLRRNTRQGSKRNIVAHYDLGNNFYRLFLDETMAYSCAIFNQEEASLKKAQLAKYQRICEKLQLSKEDHLLEIGTGWGGFAIYAATQTGCRVTTTTISDEQFALAKKRVAQAGLSDRITIIQKDYRELQGQYDKLVSIEMIEAVGHQYFDTFSRQCGQLLKPGGKMLLQAITINDDTFEEYKDSVDFINRYIFPGGCLPSVAAMRRSIGNETELKVSNLEDLTPHYVKTLTLWRENFFDHIKEVKALGYDDTFIRMWDYYLSYCKGGFLSEHIGSVQLLLSQPKSAV